jgi:hypothetical protein
MAARVHRPLKVVAFNANGTWRRRYELSKQLQDLHIGGAPLSEAHLKPHERFFIPNYHFYRTDRFPGRKGIPHKHVDLSISAIRTFDRGKPILSLESMLRKEYDREGSVEKISGRDPQGAWRQNELIGGEPPVVNN